MPQNSLQSDFVAAAERSQQPSTDWILAPDSNVKGAPTSSAKAGSAPSPPEGAGAAAGAAVSPSSSAAPAVPDPDLSFGQWVENAITGAAASAGKAVAKEATEKATASFEALKSDWEKATPPLESFKNKTFWENNQKQFDAFVAAGKLPLDAFSLAMTPISTALGLGAKAGAKALNKLSPDLFPEVETAADIEKAMMVVGPGKGGLRTMAKAGAGAGEAAAAEAAPAVTLKGAAEEAVAKGEQAPKLEITPELQKKMASFAEGKRDSPVDIAIEGLADPATRQQTVLEVAKIIPKDSVKPIAVTKANAYALQMPAEEVMARLRPSFPDDEMFAAAGAVMNSAGETFYTLSQKAVASGAPEDFADATRAYGILNKYLGDFRSAKTDWGRAGRIQQEVTEAQPKYLADIRKLIEESGVNDIEDVIRKAAALDDPKKIAPWLSTLRWMKSRQGLVFGYQNILLSNPRSVLKEGLSDLFVASWDVATRGIAEAAGGVKPGGTLQLAYGYTSSFLDGLRLAGRALVKGESQFAAEYQTVDANVKSRIAELTKAMARPGEEEQAPSAAMRYLRMAIPTQWQMAADDFNKYFHYNAHRRLYTYERAAGEGGDAEAIASSQRQLLENTPQDIHEMAMAKALKNSFQEPLPEGLQRVADVVDSANIPTGTDLKLPAGRLVMPFTKVPANITRWPVPNSPLAMLTDRYREAIAAGGSQASLARASVGLGAGVMTGVAAMSAADRLTGYGPHDADVRRFWLETHQPYSVMGPDGGWYSYLAAGPLAMIVGPVADTGDILRFGVGGKDVEQVAWSTVFGIGQAMLAPTYMMGMGNFFDAIMNPENNAKYFGQNLLASIAAPQAVWGIERATDPWRRAHYDLLDNVRSRWPGLSKDLPPQVNLWGKPVPWPQGVLWPITGSGIAQALSPIIYKPPNTAEPIDHWIYDNRNAFPRGDEGRLGLSPAGPVQTFSDNGVSVRITLDVKQVHRLRTLAGNEFKDPGSKLGAMDSFNALLAGKYPNAGTQRQWERAAPEAKAVMLQLMWAQYRAAAKDQLLSEDKKLAGHVADALGLRRELLTANPGGGSKPAVAQPRF